MNSKMIDYFESHFGMSIKEFLCEKILLTRSQLVETLYCAIIGRPLKYGSKEYR